MRVMLVSCVFLFFKQKTAYEMRISDWSSDVCSSDLERRHHAKAGRRQVEQFDIKGVETRFTETRARSHWRALGAANAPRRLCGFDEIGRVSCRESVCQYV